MPLLIQRIARGLRPAAFHPDRPPARRSSPDRIVLGVRKGWRPSAQPPVRIYLGTERGQFRAERIFIWSIEKHRDPSRIYEIYLMRDLAGFRRRFWLTGFTNYRFAIPAFAGYQGRAIYNDADQVYLKDPAELFDTPMDNAGFLSINDRDTSVMLIDCHRMRDVWNARDVRRLDRKGLEHRARQAGLWGPLDKGWNARDSEYHPERSHLVHFTTLHTQPWRPFPAEFVYFDNPTDPLWPDLEAEADRHGFLPVSASCPSPAWPAACAGLPDAEMRALLAPTPPAERHRILTVKDVLERVPDADLPWVLERLFGLADKLQVTIREPRRHGLERTRRSLWFWQQQFAAAGRLHPQTRWRLEYRHPWGRTEQQAGGPVSEGAVVVLTHRKPGHANQSRALGQQLAERSGRPLRELVIGCSETGFFLGRAFRRPPLPALGDDAAIIVAGGWLACRIARHLQRRHPRLRLLLSGRKAGPAEASGSVVVQCRHFGLPPHPNRLPTLLPLNAGRAGAASRTQRWSDWQEAPRRIALLVGGSSRSHRLDPTQAERLARQASTFARQQDARLLVVGSRRSAGIMDAIEAGLAPDDVLYRWQAEDAENPYPLALAEADALIVTGESESMLADAASRGQGFLVWPIARRSPGLWARLSRSVAERAVRPRFNRRGSIRPQQGQTYLCARALERGWILPPRDIEMLHTALYQAGMAAPFGQPIPTSFGHFPTSELERIVEQAAARLSIRLADRPAPIKHTVNSHEH
ncbi:MAG: ELM1/GtrOC1 family putative glycosyltransferase [Wenzhouxiangella sp.]